MTGFEAPLLSLADARELLRRAVDKAEDVGQRGAFVVVNEGGIVISASRMDGAGSISMGISRAKAYEAAANRETSARFAARIYGRPPSVFAAYQDILRDRCFPGPGAMPITRNGAHVGAMSSAADIPPEVSSPGVDPEKFLVEGRPANAIDLIISYAIGLDHYAPQHGDDLERWRKAYGNRYDPLPSGTGLSAPPPAREQQRLTWALAVVDAAFSEAQRRGVRISAAVADRNGDLVQLDRMDSAAPITVDLAEAKAATAVNLQAPSGAEGPWTADAAGYGRLARFPFLAVAGGLPTIDAIGCVAGALGIAGARSAEEDEEIARAALAQSRSKEYS